MKYYWSVCNIFRSIFLFPEVWYVMEYYTNIYKLSLKRIGKREMYNYECRYSDNWEALSDYFGVLCNCERI